MLSIAQYAESRGVSDSGVRRQIRRYQKELKGHIRKISNKRMLDDDAIAFLDAHRQPRSLVINEGEESTRKEIEALESTIRALQGELTRTQGKVINLQDQIITLMQHKDENLRLIESNKEKDLRIEELTGDLQSMADQYESATRELESYQPSLFGFYRKKR